MNSQAKLIADQRDLTYQIIFQNSCEPKFIIDREGIILDANNAFCERIGKRIIDCIGMNVYSILSPDNAAERKKYAETVFQSGKRVYYEEEKNGHYFRVSIYPGFVNNGTVAMIYIFVQDITEAKKAESKNKTHAAFSKEAMEAFPGAFTVLDSTGKIVSSNSYFRDIIAKDKDDDLSGINTFDIFHPDEQAFAYKKLENILLNGVEETADLRIRLHGGPEYRWFRITMVQNNDETHYRR